MFIILWAPSLRRWLTSFMRFRKYMVPITTSKTMNSFQRNCLLPAATKLWPRLCFYTCVWFCSQGGSPGRENPPGSKHPPPEQTPPQQGEPLPPGTRQTRPPLEQTPPAPPRSGRPPGPGRPPPPGKQTLAYGQRAAGTHPTGMHSCCQGVFVVCEVNIGMIVTDRKGG